MATIRAWVCTDPACPWSWAAEPALRRFPVDFAAEGPITYVMGGLARESRDRRSDARLIIGARRLALAPERSAVVPRAPAKPKPERFRGEWQPLRALPTTTMHPARRAAPRTPDQAKQSPRSSASAHSRPKSSGYVSPDAAQSFG